MNAIQFLLVLFLSIFYLQYINSFKLQFDTGFNYLTEVLSQVVSDAEVEQITVTRWIQQPLDHFNKNSQTWRMRYFERLDYYKQDGPIYIYLGGEGEASPNYLSTGTIYQLAKETRGAMFMTEHRYYGKSKPFDHLSAKNMTWLSSKQALADIAAVIMHIKSDAKFLRSKVVVIGGSYAGNLAAWMRLKYPVLVDAAIASSGPVLAKKDFFEYIEKVNENYELYGTPNCLDDTRAMFKRYKHMFQSPQGIEQLKKEHYICPEIDMSDIRNQWIFFMWHISPYMSLSQYGGPKRIKAHCSHLKKSVNVFVGKLNWSNRVDCNDVSFDGEIEYLKDTDFYHAWFYQVCTEFGYFQTTTSEDQPFGDVVPEEYYLETCKELFGSDFDKARVEEGIEETNEFYGGLAPNVTRVVFVNSDVDPWSTISVLEDISYEAPAVVIPRATHCSDLFVRPTSSEELKEANKYIKNLVKNWIGVGDDPVS